MSNSNDIQNRAAVENNRQVNSEGAIATADTGTANGPGVLDRTAQTPLAGVPVTPSGADLPAAGVAVPATDYVVTETSPNQDTSGPAAAPGSEPAAVAGESPVVDQNNEERRPNPNPSSPGVERPGDRSVDQPARVETNAGASAVAGNVPSENVPNAQTNRGSRIK